jgi:hypothetical protein
LTARTDVHPRPWPTQGRQAHLEPSLVGLQNAEALVDEIFSRRGERIEQVLDLGVDAVNGLAVAIDLLLPVPRTELILDQPFDAFPTSTRDDRVPCDAWVQGGFIEATDGKVLDYDVIQSRIGEFSKHFQIREMAYDRWGATQLSTQLQSDSFAIVPFGQAYASMSPAAKQFERLVRGRQIARGDNPVLSWMASNVAIRPDPAGNIKPDKAKSRDRIGGIVALVMAVGRATVQCEEPTPMGWGVE